MLYNTFLPNLEKSFVAIILQHLLLFTFSTSGGQKGAAETVVAAAATAHKYPIRISMMVVVDLCQIERLALLIY